MRAASGQLQSSPCIWEPPEVADALGQRWSRSSLTALRIAWVLQPMSLILSANPFHARPASSNCSSLSREFRKIKSELLIDGKLNPLLNEGAVVTLGTQLSHLFRHLNFETSHEHRSDLAAGCTETSRLTTRSSSSCQYDIMPEWMVCKRANAHGLDVL